MKSRSTPDTIQSGWSKDKAGYEKALWVNYRLTKEAYEAIWDRQQGRCVGCVGELAHPLDAGKGDGFKALPDWDDDTPRPSSETTKGVGYTRGLVCQKCKTLLGELEGNLDVMDRLRSYLRENGK